MEKLGQDQILREQNVLSKALTTTALEIHLLKRDSSDDVFLH